MTEHDIAKAIAMIKKTAGDDEAAHAMEDRLHRDFIAFVAATGPDSLRTLADQVLTTQTIKFGRW